ncbi:hypothetical protein [Erwinia sp. HR93]|uniref:hypothetical protein n=1 Tax=Erwinia sp. HR93 TaxID=3094840 RepID=UPI002ADEF505|nr:hypothetical protein [Erwinia sp. HR93]MEA1065278.1 hypothetical protein [Erwinia sp. HR93]
MRNVLITLCAVSLAGCINVYGPVKTGMQDAPSDMPSAGMSAGAQAAKIGNRKPDELFNAVTQHYREKGLNSTVEDSGTGIIAAAGDDPELSAQYLDCSMLSQTQNIQEHYRIVTQVWSAGEGSNIAVSVTGVAGLTAPDGNDKVKPVECKSTGVFERDLLERLKK